MAYRCRCCGRKQKFEDEEGWLLGIETPEEPGGRHPSNLQKTIVFPDRWDVSHARECDAVHFCSAECKQEYISMWYSELSAIASTR